MEEHLAKKRQEIAMIQSVADRQKAATVSNAKRFLLDTINALGSSVRNLDDLRRDEVQKLVLEKATERIKSASQQDLFQQDLVEAMEKEIGETVEEVIRAVIPIPRVIIQQKDEVRCGFRDFDLDAGGLNYPPVSEEIIRRTLRTNENEVLQSTGVGVIRDTAENIIVNELMNYDEVDYGRESALLYKLVGQAVGKLGRGRSAEELRNIVLYHKHEIGRYIYAQLQKHFFIEAAEFEKPVIYPFTKIEPHNFSKYTADSVYHYTETITPTHAISSKVFGGFKKACHNFYKFDSKAEKDLAAILEQDPDVFRWLRPAQAQFFIYWKHNSQRYTPDFVVETNYAIYMVEVKAEGDIDDTDVLEKAEAGRTYCDAVTEYNLQNNGKRWAYVLIPHTAVSPNMSFGYLAGLGSDIERPDVTAEIDGFLKDLLSDDSIEEYLKYNEYLPVLTLQAAAGGFKEQVTPEPIGWKRVDINCRPEKEMFIAQVVGKSMEPTIPNGSWCLFRVERGGSRNGKVVLVESRLVSDPETSQAFTVKRYHSEKENFSDGTWRHKRITLSPDNKEFGDIILENVSGEDFRVVAEFLEVLTEERMWT